MMLPRRSYIGQRLIDVKRDTTGKAMELLFNIKATPGLIQATLEQPRAEQLAFLMRALEDDKTASEVRVIVWKLTRIPVTYTRREATIQQLSRYILEVVRANKKRHWGNQIGRNRKFFR